MTAFLKVEITITKHPHFAELLSDLEIENVEVPQGQDASGILGND